MDLNTTVERAPLLFEPVTHPILESCDPKMAAQFLKRRRRYELEIKENKKEIPGLTAASYLVSIDRALLENMHALGKFDDIAPGKTEEQLTSTHVENYIKGLVTRDDDSEVDPTVIVKAMRNVRVPMNIEDTNARMLQFVSKILVRLEGVSYGDFKDRNPRKTIELIQEKLYPPMLKSSMKEQLEFQEDLKTNLKAYVKLLCKEARVCEKAIKSHTSYDAGLSDTKIRRPNKKMGKGANYNGAKPSKVTLTGRSEDQRKVPPLCLNSTHIGKGIRHYLNECDITGKEQAERPLKEYKEKRRASKVSDTRCNVDFSNMVEESSTKMNAQFGGTVTKMLCADGGSDINLMDDVLLAALTAAGADMKLTVFRHPQTFGLSTKQSTDGSEVNVSCTEMAVMSVELKIRHAKSLTIRNVPWHITEQEMSEPLLGRPVLEALGLDTKGAVAAACDRLEGVFDAKDLVPRGFEKVARIRTEGVFHSDGALSDNAGESDDAELMDIGEISEAEIKGALKKLVDAAQENGIGKKQIVRLQCLLDRY